MITDLGSKVVSFSSQDISSIKSISDEIATTGADFAAYLDSNADNLILIDSYGNVIKDELFL